MQDAGVEAVRAAVRSWLQEAWDPELPLHEWRGRLADAGWARPSWPPEWYGRGLAVAADAAVAEEIEEFGAIGVPTGVGVGLAAPTIMAHGDDELKRRFLRPTLTGEYMWCQLFSEPGSGSDLAGLATTAVRDGDEWVVNGQKVWTTSAHHADLGLLLARSDWDAPKHRGITCLLLPMDQPGVEVRPLRQMNGHASFNEVFFTDARVPVANTLGPPGGGWAVAVTTLAHERRLGGLRPPRFADGIDGRAVQEARAESEQYFRTYRWYPQRAGRADLVVERARALGRDTDPVVRQEIARLLSLLRAAQWTAQRAQAARALGRDPGPEGSIGKLGASHVARLAARVHALIAGPAAMLSGPDSPAGGVIAEVLVSVPAVSIAGGTDEIQRNIIGERVLGLPKEPQVDADRPFREVPRNTR